MDAFAEKLTTANWTPHDQRTFAALLNAFRLSLRELGIKPSKSGTAQSGSLRDYWGDGRASRPAAPRAPRHEKIGTT